MNRQASFFADRLRQHAGGDLTVQVDQAFQIALSRDPDTDERQHLLSLAQSHGIEQVCRAIFNTSEFVFLP